MKTTVDAARRRSSRWLVATLLVLHGGTATSGAESPDAANYRQVLQLLAGIGSEYREAFDDQGNVVRAIDIDETKLLLAQLGSLMQRLPIGHDPDVGDALDGLSTMVERQDPAAIVVAYVEVFRRAVIQASGVHEDIVPPERPSLVRGRDLYRENCAGCHGLTGAGDGVDAARLGLKPANFSDPSFMRAETPRDAFNVIMLGRQKSGMPAWGAALSPQQVWDLVSYLWSLARTPASLAAGEQIFSARCAACHGAHGDPAQAQASDLDRPIRSFGTLIDSAEISDAELFAAISTGVPRTSMPAFAAQLSDDDRWAVVAFTRSLSLEGAPGSAAEPLEPDYVAEMNGIERLIDTALDAHRRGDDSAPALATNAYFRFEPLEKPLSEIDQARVETLERDFLAFRTALQNTASGDPTLLGKQLHAELTQAAELLRPARPQPTPAAATAPGWTAGQIAVVVAFAFLGGICAVSLLTRRAGSGGVVGTAAVRESPRPDRPGQEFD